MPYHVLGRAEQFGASVVGVPNKKKRRAKAAGVTPKYNIQGENCLTSSDKIHERGENDPLTRQVIPHPLFR